MFRPRSRRLVEVELKRKGVDAATIRRVTEGLDEESSAYRAAKKKASSLRGLDYASFRRRLWSFLRRRGFAYDEIDHATDRAWKEQAGNKTGAQYEGRS